MKKCISIILVLCCVFLYACTPPPDDSEFVEYAAIFATLSQGYGPAVKDGVTKSPIIESDFQLPEQQVLTIDGKTYVAEYSTQFLGKAEYQCYSNPSITYSLFADTGKFASISLIGGTINYNKIFEEQKTEQEYLDWIRALLAEYGIDDLDEYVYTCKTFSGLGSPSEGFKTPDDLIGYDFTFTRYVDGIKTDDVVSLTIYNDSFSFSVGSGKFKDFDNAVIDKLQCRAVADSFMQDTLADGWSFTGTELDNLVLKSRGDMIYAEYSYLVTLRNSTGDEISAAYVIDVFLE